MVSYHPTSQSTFNEKITTRKSIFPPVLELDVYGHIFLWITCKSAWYCQKPLFGHPEIFKNCMQHIKMWFSSYNIPSSINIRTFSLEFTKPLHCIAICFWLCTGCEESIGLPIIQNVAWFWSFCAKVMKKSHIGWV